MKSLSSFLIPDQLPENDVEENEGKNDEYEADQAELTAPESEEDQDGTGKSQKKFLSSFHDSLCCFRSLDMNSWALLHQSTEAVIIQAVNRKFVSVNLDLKQVFVQRDEI